jgi:hypothetical protein
LEVRFSHGLEGRAVQLEPVKLWSEIAKNTGNQIQKQNTGTDFPSHQVLPSYKSARTQLRDLTRRMFE